MAGAVTAAALTLTACTDRVPSTAPTNEPPTEAPVLTRMRGTVDVAAGTMTFEPIRSSLSASLSGGRGPSAAIYGDQGTTVQIYNSTVAVSPSANAGKKLYSAAVGLRNLLDHSIGDEQVGAADHNLGIFVFVSTPPVVTGTPSSPCSPACTVTVFNHHGIYNFDAPGQRYWFYPYQLSEMGGGSDTTIERRTWTFEADTQVTAFQFEVLVSAAWPSTEESRWKVDYTADSLPNFGTEPAWVRTAVGAASTSINTPSAGIIRVNVSSGQNLVYTRADSIGTAQDAYIEARLTVPLFFAPVNPEISFGLDDRVKFIAVGLNNSQAGFLTGQGSLAFAASTAVTTSSPQTYQMRKFGSDSVVLFVNGTRVLAQAYSAFPSPLLAAPTHGFYFGPLGTGPNHLSASGNASEWDYVIYEIGVTQP